jgi:SnoaL-like protein
MSDLTDLKKFAKRYAEAWCGQNAESVAAFFAENGSLSVNDGPSAVGRAAIAEIARGFMRTFPDMIVTMEDVSRNSHGTKFHWTLTGTNAGPGGTGKHVRISGYELWRFNTPDSSQNRKAISTARSTNVSSRKVSMANAAGEFTNSRSRRWPWPRRAWKLSRPCRRCALCLRR